MNPDRIKDDKKLIHCPDPPLNERKTRIWEELKEGKLMRK
jgi:hypothetical protein